MLGDRVPNVRVKIVDILRKVAECKKRGILSVLIIITEQENKNNCKSALEVLTHDRDTEVKKISY